MICIPIMARDNAEALIKISRASPLADLLEIRLDVMESFDLAEIIRKSEKPIIVTYRSKKEGGSGLAPYETRVRHLSKAVELGASYVDIEYSMPQIYRQEIFQTAGMSKRIISAHMSRQTPSKEEMEDLFRKMAATGAEIVKLITYANEPEDSLRVLGLIPFARQLGVEVIVFCMGRAGRISRIFTLLLGGYLSFASLGKGQESASGQIPVADMRMMLAQLS